jgi:hypothetical protein
VERLSERILQFLHDGKDIDFEDKSQLTILIKLTNPPLAKLMRNSVHFQHMRFMLVTPNDYMGEQTTASSLPHAIETLSVILKTPDDQLVRNGINYYKTEQSERHNSKRLKHFQTLVDAFQNNPCSEFKIAFATEWLFEKALVEAVLNDQTVREFTKTLRFAAEHYGAQVYIMRGIIKALQKDISFLASYPLQKNSDQRFSLLDQAHAYASIIFPYFVNLAVEDVHFVAKYIANWAIELPIQNEDHRFFKRSQWRWIRTLSARSWDASLREPPLWVVEGGSQYCATIFHCAPSLWLQEYSFMLLEQVHSETTASDFEPTEEHFNYVEFLIRSIRKKSPFFASRTESLYALHLLNRLTRTEALQYASAEARFQSQISHHNLNYHDLSSEFSLWKEILLNPDVQSQLGKNPIARALSVMMRLALETAKK